MASAPIPAEWIEWSGGECPVSDSALVAIQCRGESQRDAEKEEPVPAAEWRWAHLGRPSDIIAYQVTA